MSNLFYQLERDYLQMLKRIKEINPNIIINCVVSEESVITHLSGDVRNQDVMTYIVNKGELVNEVAKAQIKALQACLAINGIELWAMEAKGLKEEAPAPVAERAQRTTALQINDEKEVKTVVFVAAEKENANDNLPAGEKANDSNQAQLGTTTNELGIKLCDDFVHPEYKIDSRVLFQMKSKAIDEAYLYLKSLNTGAYEEFERRKTLEQRTRVRYEGLIKMFFTKNVMDLLIEGNYEQPKVITAPFVIPSEATQSISPDAGSKTAVYNPTAGIAKTETNETSTDAVKTAEDDLRMTIKMLEDPMENKRPSKEIVEIASKLIEVYNYTDQDYLDHATDATKEKYPDFQDVILWAPQESLDEFVTAIKNYAVARGFVKV